MEVGLDGGESDVNDRVVQAHDEKAQAADPEDQHSPAMRKLCHARPQSLLIGNLLQTTTASVARHSGGRMDYVTALSLNDAERRARLNRRHLLSGSRLTRSPSPARCSPCTPPTRRPSTCRRRRGALPAPGSRLLCTSRRAWSGCSRCGARCSSSRTSFAPVVHAATTRAIASRERGRLIVFIEQDGLTKDGSGAA